MQIDWLTVIAQIINFLVLVWLLQRFLYRPIKHAMERREARIEERLSEAQSARSDAKAEKEKLEDERSALKTSKAQVLDQAHQEADELRERLEGDIREEMENKRHSWRMQLEAEREDFTRALQKRAGHQSIEIARRVLEDYANSELTGQVAEVFIERLQTLEDDVLQKLSDAASRTGDPALVESGSELKTAARKNITRAIHACVSKDMEVQYREDEDLVLGFRLTIGEQTLEWSAARHLKALDTTLDEILDNTRPVPKTKTG